MKPTHLLQFDVSDYPNYFAVIEHNKGDRHIKALFVQVDSWESGDSHAISLCGTQVCGSGYYKWDSCNHINLTGDSVLNDSYYHLCGSKSYNRFFDFLKSVQYAASTLIDGYLETVNMPDLDEHCKIKIFPFEESQDKVYLSYVVEEYNNAQGAKK